MTLFDCLKGQLTLEGQMAYGALQGSAEGLAILTTDADESTPAYFYSCHVRAAWKMIDHLMTAEEFSIQLSVLLSLNLFSVSHGVRVN